MCQRVSTADHTLLPSMSTEQHVPGYTGFVPQIQNVFGTTYGKATNVSLLPVRYPSPKRFEYKNNETMREVSQMTGIPGPGFTGFLNGPEVLQGSEVDLPTY